MIDGSIGELSPFHLTFRYYGHGIREEAARLPKGWRERLITIENENTNGVRGLCLEVHDLAVAKLVASREKDIGFLSHLAHHRMISENLLTERVALLPNPTADELHRIHSHLPGLFPNHPPPASP